MTPPDASNPWREIGRRLISTLTLFALLVGWRLYVEEPATGWRDLLASVAGISCGYAAVLAVLGLFQRSLQPDLASRRAGRDQMQGPIKRSAPFLSGDPRGEGGGGGGA